LKQRFARQLAHCVVYASVRTAQHLPEHFVLRLRSQFLFVSLVIAQVRSHQTLPQLAMIWHAEMQELVNNHMVLQLPGSGEQRLIKRKPAGGRAARPFTSHLADNNGPDAYFQPRCPIACALGEILPGGVAFRVHAVLLISFSTSFSTIPATSSRSSFSAYTAKVMSLRISRSSASLWAQFG
jgi:hypothetical protein